jgi:uncharacterized protein (DUF4415 family)
MKKTPDPNKMKRIHRPVLGNHNRHQAKVRITTYLDADLLSNLKTQAQESGGKYQTTLNQILRNYFTESQNNSVFKRLAKLEKSVFRDKTPR